MLHTKELIHMTHLSHLDFPNFVQGNIIKECSCIT